MPSATTSGSVNANTGGSKGGMQSKTVGAIVGVFLAVILICVLLVVFHNADRRYDLAAVTVNVLKFYTQVSDKMDLCKQCRPRSDSPEGAI